VIKQNTQQSLTLGSLFDGIGGFPYAASFFGIRPLWASEIMPHAISVTQKHLPEMEHLGDITTLKGAELPPADIITFGSPCQGLSMAGRRLGLADERSGLFSEAIRIIYEMREATNGRYPRYAVWENVPGALSSNSGFDYKAVLEAFTKAEVPIPRSGKWANSGMVRSDGIDLAWCVYNAQYFGVPQRRRRIFLVCDFSGRSAGEILFKPKSLSGYFEACREKGQKIAVDATGSTDGTGLPSDKCTTECLNPWDVQQSRVFTGDGLSPTLAGADGGGGRNPAGLVYCSNSGQSDSVISEELAGTLTCIHEQPFVYEPKTAAFLDSAGAKARGIGYSEKISPTLKSDHAPSVCESVTILNDQGGERFSVEASQLSPTLRSESHGNNPIVAVNETPAVTMRLREGKPGGGKGPLLQSEKCGTLASGNDQYLFAPQIAVGVHQGIGGDVNISDTAYCLSTNGQASGRNAPLICKTMKAFSLSALNSNSMLSSNPLSGCQEIETARTIDTTNPCPSKNQGGVAVVAQASGFMSKGNGDCTLLPECHYNLSCGGGQAGQGYPAVLVDVHPTVVGTLTASAGGLNRPGGMGSETDLCVAYCLQGNMIGRQDHNGPKGNGINEEIAFTLTATDVSGVAKPELYQDVVGALCHCDAKGINNQYVCQDKCVVTKYLVRRLTPVECERLQGYPDVWTQFGHDGKEISDTRRYQMLGNSIAVPCVAYIMLGIIEHMNGSS